MSEHATNLRTAVPAAGSAGRRYVHRRVGAALPASPVRGPGQGQRTVPGGGAGADRRAGRGGTPAPVLPGPGRYGIAAVTASAGGLAPAAILAVGHLSGWW